MSGHDHHGHDHSHHNHARGSLTQRAAMASVSMALFLLGLKGWAAYQTGSVSMLGSLADTGLDIVASLVTLYSVRLAAQPADKDHRFGHGKAEALFQTGIISASALAIGWRGVTRFGHDVPPEHPELGIIVSVIAIILTFALITYQRFVVKKTGSVAIHADHVHYASDLMLNASVIAALVLDSMLHVRGADPLFGVAIAGWLLWHAREVASTAIDQLMDKEWPLEKRERFLAVAASHPELKGIHDVRTRTSGAHDFVQLHVWVDPQMTVAAAHRVMDEIEANLMAQFPGTEVIIHPEPEGHTEGHHDIAAEEMDAE
jgi:ferrous-iron efflux pump FieF